MKTAEHITNLHIQIMIHAACYPGPMQNWWAPAVQQYAAQLVQAGLLVPAGVRDNTPLTWHTTERGNTWLTMLRSTPYPVAHTAWLDPREID